jgi:hypothetical protein
LKTTLKQGCKERSCSTGAYYAIEQWLANAQASLKANQTDHRLPDSLLPHFMTFTDYLLSKKIDPVQFAAADPKRYAEWAELFASMHPESFTVQKKFLLNPTRRKYLLR